MKKCVYLSTIFFIIMVLYAACTGNAPKQNDGDSNMPSDSTIDSYLFANIDTAALFPIDKFSAESPALSLQLSLDTVVANNSNSAQINNTIIYATFGYDEISVAKAIDSFIKTSKKEYYAMRADYINEKNMEHSASWLNNSYSIKGRCLGIHDNIINYIIENDTYEGGAHGLFTQTLLNIDCCTGREIRLSDIFIENFETVLTEQLTERLAKNVGAANVDDLKEWGYTALNDMYPTENFMLGKDSIIFLYNPYEIAPYALGIIRVALGLDEIKAISMNDKK